MKANPQQNEHQCSECDKKQQLLQKYANMIELLRNKTPTSYNSISFKQSMDAPSSTSTQLSSNSKLCKGALLLMLLQLQRKSKKQVFQALCELAIAQKCHKGFKMSQALDRCINRKTQEGIRQIWLNKNKHLTLVERQTLDKQKEFAILSFSQCTKSAAFLAQPLSLNEKTRNMARNLFTLTEQVKGLKSQKKMLVVQIEQNLRRQEIQSKKKKESLQMLAQQMAEKNELITQLQETLRFYQAKLGKIGGNVLQDDSLATKKELQTLEKVNQKINVQLEKRGLQLTKLQEQLKSVTERYLKLEAENSSLKQRNFEMGVQMQGLQKRKKEYQSLSSYFQHKLSNLKKYEKMISNSLKALDHSPLSDKSGFNHSLKFRNSKADLQEGGEHNGQEKQQNPTISPIGCFEAQYKVQKVLNYIFNIQLDDFWMKNDSKLFDNEQLQVLNSLKLKFIQLNEQVKTLSKPKEVQKTEIAQIKQNGIRLSQQYGQSDEVYFNRNHVSGSIFDVLATQKNNKDKDNNLKINNFEGKCCTRCTNSQSQQKTSRKGEQNFTIRLLQLQLQKSKQVEKISELKNKLMHIRCIVMNLIKCLDLRSISKEAREIVEIFCEFFEYSQEEKELIYHLARKERKFLGLF